MTQPDADARAFAATVTATGRTSLPAIPPTQAARIRRRIVDGEALSPRLDVAAFNSAP